MKTILFLISVYTSCLHFKNIVDHTFTVTHMGYKQNRTFIDYSNLNLDEMEDKILAIYARDMTTKKNVVDEKDEKEIFSINFQDNVKGNRENRDKHNKKDEKLRKKQNPKSEDMIQTTEQNIKHFIEFIHIIGKPQTKKIRNNKKQNTKSIERIQSTTDSNEVEKWNDMDWTVTQNVKTTEETITTDNNIIENVIDVDIKEDEVETTETLESTIQPVFDFDLDDKTTEEPDYTIKHSSERTCQIHKECPSEMVCTKLGVCKYSICKSVQDCKKKVNLPVLCIRTLPGKLASCNPDAYCENDEDCQKAGSHFRCQPDTYQCKPTYGVCEKPQDCIQKYKMNKREAICSTTIVGWGRVCMCRSDHVAQCSDEDDFHFTRRLIRN